MKQVITMLSMAMMCQQVAAENYTLADALRQKLVSISMTGAGLDTTNYTNNALAPSMSMLVTNLSSSDISLNLEYGYKLEPSDTTYQTMMVTQTLIVRLPAKQKKTYRLYAMCTQAGDRGPSESEHFSLGKRSTGNLLGMAELINHKRYQYSAAQDAVWCLTDNRDIQNISSSDTTMMYELRRFVAKAKGLPASSIYSTTSSYTEPIQTYRTRTVYSGELTYSMSRPAKILVALFDGNNRMKRVYVNNETQREGQYSYTYNLSSDDLGEGKYYIRMFRDGKMEDEILVKVE